MSHYIQDTQAVVQTKDNKFLFFIKGGGNNVSSMASNKRCTSWWFVGTFASKEAFDTYIDVVSQSDINGGSWQFQSLKNKSFNGFTEYDVTVFKRFDRAFKAAKTVDWNLSDVDVSNILSFENKISELFSENNISMKDQDGNSIFPYICSAYDKEEKYTKGVERLNRLMEYSDKVKVQGYREFCYKWADSTVKECFENVDFCKELTNFRDSWNGIDYLRSNQFNISTEHIHALFDEHKEVLLEQYFNYADDMLGEYPEQFTDYFKNSNFFTEAIEIVEESEKENKYCNKRKVFDLFKKFSDGVNLVLVKAKKERDAQELIEAPSLFVKTWNSLIDNTYYKTTKSIIARDMELLNKYFKAGNLDLSVIRDECEDDFYKIIENHKNQYKKNQPMIKKLAEILLGKYCELLNSRSIISLSDYFGIETTQRVSEVKSTRKVEKTQASSLFD